MSTQLTDYIMAHAVRGDCVCGKCIDAAQNPQQPTGHTADLMFFKVAAKDADAETLRALVKAHKGHYGDVDLLDGKEHSYLEIGGYVGDQGLALMLMGLGKVLGLWDLLTPRSVFGGMIPDDVAMQMAGGGLVVIQSAPPSHDTEN